MDSHFHPWTARAMLAWQIEAGADEAILDAPVDRYALDVVPPAAAPPPVATDPVHGPSVGPSDGASQADAIADARRMAAAAASLPDLAAAVAAYPHCDLRRGARSTVFADGSSRARILIVTDPPDREADLAAKPVAGAAEVLLDRMLDAVGLARSHPDPAHGVYIVPVLPWRAPAGSAPEASDIARMLPFLERHIALADPVLIVLMGNVPCQALLGRAGITRLRGAWAEVAGRPALAMVPPAALLGKPEAKRHAWADLLALRARLDLT